MGTDRGDAFLTMLRRWRGPFGIAMSATVLARHAQLHQTRLADHVTSFNPVVQDWLRDATHGLFAVSGHDPVTTQTLSLGMLYGQVQQQAAMLAFVDVFRMLMFAFVLFLPFILLLSSGKGRRAPGAH